MRRSTRLFTDSVQGMSVGRAAIQSSAICHRCQARMSYRRLPQPQRQQQLSTSSCRRAESIKRETHYDFFPEAAPTGPPPQGPFKIDLKLLRKEFIQMQAEAHPDRHPQEHKGRAEALSARINDAYKTLQDPLLRAQYILSLKGIDVAEDETAKVEDQQLLMQVLESQETIEEAQEEGQLEPLKVENNQRLDDTVRALDEAFTHDDIETAKREAVRLRYWVNIRDSLTNWEPGKPVTLIH